MTVDCIVLNEDGAVAKIIERVKSHDVVLVCGGSPVIGDMHCGKMDFKVIDIFTSKNVPEHGHYRVDFRTGKPLRY